MKFVNLVVYFKIKFLIRCKFQNRLSIGISSIKFKQTLRMYQNEKDKICDHES